MVTYRPWLQSFPANLVDVKSVDEAYPHITFVTRKEFERAGEEEDEGWLFIVLDVEIIDLETTRKAIAEAIGVKPEDVIIEDDEEDEGVIIDEP